jgi:hypothetical protein
MAVTRRILLLVPFPALRAFAEQAYSALRGQFSRGGRLKQASGRVTRLRGDEETKLVLDDPRLEGMDFEALGRAKGPEEFEIGPIHERNMWVHRDGKRLMVTYWCPICYIRTYSPGLCMCCREDTKLDLRDPALER